MAEGQTPEFLDGPDRPMSRRSRTILLVVAGLLVAVGAFVVSQHRQETPVKDEEVARIDTGRKQLSVAQGHETTARIDAVRASRVPGLAFADTKRYPADLAAFDAALKTYRRTPVEGDAVAWYFARGEYYMFCVEHRTAGEPDAYALYASTVGDGFVGTDHGGGCTRPAGFAEAAELVALLVSGAGGASTPPAR